MSKPTILSSEDKQENNKTTDLEGVKEEKGLSIDFFSQLIKQPSCRKNGYCDNCGRCQH